VTCGKVGVLAARTASHLSSQYGGTEMTSSSITDFSIIPANKLSIAARWLGKRIYGVGINDADYITSPTIKGRQLVCPLYKTWTNMLTRCYSAKAQEKNPSYIGSTVCDEWVSFMAFRAWMVTQDWQDKHLDKDLLIIGNKEYSPKTCIFIPPAINTLLNKQESAGAGTPLGVRIDKRDGVFQAFVSKRGRKVYLGRYSTQGEASAAYRKAKADHIKGLAQKEAEPLRSALMRHAKLIGG